MKKIIFVGAVQKTGEYEGRQYDNVYMYFAESKPDVIGYLPFTVKVKSKNVYDVCGCTFTELSKLCLEECTLEFNRFGSVDNVTFDNVAF